MELPLHFPDPLVEAAKRCEEFQRLPQDARWREIASLMELGLAMTQASPRRDWIIQNQAKQEAEWQLRQQELFARYAG